MKDLIYLLSFLITHVLIAQSIDVQFVPIAGSCTDTQYCVSLQVRSSDAGNYLGNSSIRFSYDDSVIYFNGDSYNQVNNGSYKPINFDANTIHNECNTIIAPYADQAFDGMTSGDFILTLVLLSPTTTTPIACPSLDDWTEVSQICFDLLDPTGNPNLTLTGTEYGFPSNYAGTAFNDDTNDPANKYQNGNFTDVQSPFNLFCSDNVNGVNISPIVFLQGASLNTTGSLMRDDLRANNLLPTIEPYMSLADFNHVNGGNEIANASVFDATGNDAVVDWVYVALHADNDPQNIIATRAGLLQRDGDVVDIDGSSPLNFPTVSAGNYYVSIRHRNHLGVMTQISYALNNTTTTIDFSNNATYGTQAQVELPNGNYAMWAGNTNAVHSLIFQGANNENDGVFFTVLTAPYNTSFSSTYIYQGYHTGDIDMNSEVIYQGNSNESNVVFFNILSHPNNTNTVLNYIIQEQMP